MPTKNPRINVTFETQIAELLAEIAKQENISISSLAKELIIEALDRREDIALSLLAEKRDSKKKLELIEHDEAWK